VMATSFLVVASRNRVDIAATMSVRAQLFRG
jgi:hypothetical protein